VSGGANIKSGKPGRKPSDITQNARRYTLDFVRRRLEPRRRLEGSEWKDHQVRSFNPVKPTGSISDLGCSDHSAGV
jgi:hypothetical protein